MSSKYFKAKQCRIIQSIAIIMNYILLIYKYVSDTFSKYLTTEKNSFFWKKGNVINLRPRWQTATVQLKTKNNAPLYFMSVLPSKTLPLFLTTKYYFQPVKNIQSGLKHVCIFLPSFIFFPCTVKKGYVDFCNMNKKYSPSGSFY